MTRRSSIRYPPGHVARLALLAACGAILSACGAPLSKATPEQIARLDRGLATTPPGATATAPAHAHAHAHAHASAPAIAFLRAGDPRQPRIIYIHGTPGSAEGWADYLVDPIPDAESIAVDRLGFGSSTPSRCEPSFAAQAAALEPLLVEREGRWPILVGHSLGGPIAAWLAATRPERVGALVIVAGSLDPDLERPGLGQQIASTALVRFFLPRSLDHCMGELDAARAETERLAPRLSQIRCPVVVIHGTEDRLVPFANVDYMRRMFTHAASLELVDLVGEGHFVPWRRPDMIRQSIRRLLDSPGPRSQASTPPQPEPTPPSTN